MMYNRPENFRILVFSQKDSIPAHFNKSLANEGYAVENVGCLEDALFCARKLCPHCMVVDLHNNRDDTSALISTLQYDPLLARTQFIFLIPGNSLQVDWLQLSGFQPIRILARQVGVSSFLAVVRQVIKKRIAGAKIFGPNQMPSVILKTQGVVTGTNECELIVKAPVRLATNSLLQVSSDVLGQIGMSGCVFKRTSRPATSVGDSTFLNEVSVIGIHPEAVRQTNVFSVNSASEEKEVTHGKAESYGS